MLSTLVYGLAGNKQNVKCLTIKAAITVSGAIRGGGADGRQRPDGACTQHLPFTEGGPARHATTFQLSWCLKVFFLAKKVTLWTHKGKFLIRSRTAYLCQFFKREGNTIVSLALSFTVRVWYLRRKVCFKYANAFRQCFITDPDWIFNALPGPIFHFSMEQFSDNQLPWLLNSIR